MEFLWIMLYLIIVMIVVIVCAVIADDNKIKKQHRLQALYAECATLGNIYQFYGADGRGNPFTDVRHRIVVLSVIDDWVQYSDEVYSAETGDLLFTNKDSTTLKGFYEWLILRNAKQIKLQ